MGRRHSAVPPILPSTRTTSRDAEQGASLAPREELRKRKPFVLSADLHHPSALFAKRQNFSFFNVR
jgi:hypothetical protein